MVLQNSLPVTEADQLEFFLMGMRKEEVSAIRSYLKAESSLDDSVYNPGLMITLSHIVESIFIRTFMSRLGNKVSDTLTAFEKLIEWCSPTFLSFVARLDLGATGLEFCPSPGIWKKLPYNIGKLVNLRYLYLNQQPIGDLTPLAPLELNFVCLESCPITDVSHLNFKRLGWMNIRETNITNNGIDYVITHGQRLGIIPLERTQINDPEKILALTKLSACTMLWLDGTPVLKELPAIIGPFHQKETSYEVVDQNEKEKRNAQMIRPTWYGNMDYLDFCPLSS